MTLAALFRRRVEVESDDEPIWVTVKGCGGNIGRKK